MLFSYNFFKKLVTKSILRSITYERQVKTMDKDFEKVYREYYPSVYRYMLSVSKDPHTAEEITQETFFKALKNIEKYDKSQNILTWLCTIAKNTYYSKLKKSSHYQPIAEDTATTDGDIIDAIIDSEDSMAILRTLHDLPEPYKEVFTLRVLGSFSFGKIAEVFHKSESWARVTFFRAKQMIKERMDNE